MAPPPRPQVRQVTAAGAPVSGYFGSSGGGSSHGRGHVGESAAHGLDGGGCAAGDAAGQGGFLDAVRSVHGGGGGAGVVGVGQALGKNARFFKIRNIFGS
jgi:hypothetical protein